MKTARFSVCIKVLIEREIVTMRKFMNDSLLLLDLDISASYRTRNMQARA
jgi:hypothetical protein